MLLHKKQMIVIIVTDLESYDQFERNPSHPIFDDRCLKWKSKNRLDCVLLMCIELGFEVLAFPSNQFGNQEPGSNEQIKEFACSRYKAEFPIFDKVMIKLLHTSSSQTFQLLIEKTMNSKELSRAADWNVLLNLKSIESTPLILETKIRFSRG